MNDTELDTTELARTLWPHNSHAVEDQAIEIAVHVAWSIPNDQGVGVPLLRQARESDRPAMPLFNAVFDPNSQPWTDHDFFAAPCDRCKKDVQPTHSLWVVTGESVIDIHCCERCRRDLDGALHNLVWV